MTSFILDISKVSHSYLPCIQDKIRQSKPEHLTLMCTPFDPCLSDSVAQLLSSVQWPSLKSLVLSGENLDGWMQRWPSTINPQILCLKILGTGPDLQHLSHASAMFLHQVIYSSPLTELCFERFELLDTHNWPLVIESIDSSFLKTMGFCTASFSQLMATASAGDLLISKFEVVNQEAGNAKVVVPSLTLDTTPRAQQKLGRIQRFFSECCLEQLIILCTTFDPTQTNLIVQVLESVPWSTLKSLELSGDDIAGWLRILPSVPAPHLKCLDIRGSGLAPLRLSHEDIRCIQQLTDSWPLEELRFDNVVSVTGDPLSKAWIHRTEEFHQYGSSDDESSASGAVYLRRSKYKINDEDNTAEIGMKYMEGTETPDNGRPSNIHRVTQNPCDDRPNTEVAGNGNAVEKTSTEDTRLEGDDRMMPISWSSNWRWIPRFFGADG